MKDELDKKQKEVNELYAKDGLTDEILDKQIQINKLRNKHNIADDSKKTFVNFVQ